MAISRKLSPFIAQWLLLFLPFQNLSHFRTLLDFFAELIFYRNVTAQRKVYLFYLICGMFCFQYAYLWAFLLPPLERLRLGDFGSLVFQTNTYYSLMLTEVLMLMYFIHVLFATMKAPYLRLLGATLFRDTTRTLSGVAYGRFTEQATVRIAILGLVNLLHVFVLVADAVLLFGICTLISTAFENPGELLGNPLHTPLTFLWNVLQMILGSWTTATCVALYSKVLIITGSIGIGHMWVLFRRLVYSETLLGVYARKSGLFSWAPFRQYLTYSGQTFEILFTVNHLFARLFVVFLLVNMPVSAWTVVQLSLGSQSGSSVIGLSFMPAYQLIGCILLHAAMAKLTKRLHRPSKALLSLSSATGHRMGNFRARLQLHHTIVRLHSKAQYGITYGSVGGLITMGSFAKCMLLYTELLMYAYKLIRGI